MLLLTGQLCLLGPEIASPLASSLLLIYDYFSAEPHSIFFSSHRLFPIDQSKFSDSGPPTKDYKGFYLHPSDCPTPHLPIKSVVCVLKAWAPPEGWSEMWSLRPSSPTTPAGQNRHFNNSLVWEAPREDLYLCLQNRTEKVMIGKICSYLSLLLLPSLWGGNHSEVHFEWN